MTDVHDGPPWAIARVAEYLQRHPWPFSNHSIGSKEFATQRLPVPPICMDYAAFVDLFPVLVAMCVACTRFLYSRPCAWRARVVVVQYQ